jgi:hypothetical protein
LITLLRRRGEENGKYRGAGNILQLHAVALKTKLEEYFELLKINILMGMVCLLKRNGIVGHIVHLGDFGIGWIVPFLFLLILSFGVVWHPVMLKDFIICLAQVSHRHAQNLDLRAH